MVKEKRKSKIGGQALIEGVMMRGLDKVSMAVRIPNGEIDIESWEVDSIVHPKWYRKIPILRGVVNLISSLILGYKCLMKSAQKAGIYEDEDEQSLIDQKSGNKIFKIAGIIGTVLGFAAAIILFMFFPSLIVKMINNLFNLNSFGKALIEGLIKIIIFIGYLFVISMLSDIKRTFEYHGAEHKTISCYEADYELTPKNVKKFTRFHPRCGTSFLLIVLIISIIIFSVVTWDNLFMRVALKITLLPIVIGLAYELIRIAGKYDNIFTKIISAPGLWLQRLTTREPDIEEIEVAIAAFNEVMPENKEEDKW
ncbi:MAG: DUF1385 domain-containing protein [Oscillospiraceae bacterium]|nr:DUF1385 domain-containing protein [Oscillospiraceae bacterium]